MQIVDGSNTRQGAALRSMEEKARVPKTQEWRDQQAAIRESLERASTHCATPRPSKPKRSRRPPPPWLTKTMWGQSPPPVPFAKRPRLLLPSAPPHNYKPSQPKPSISPTAPNSVAPRRKPPQPATPPAKERKNAVHRTSGG
jgi:hypothetical protein